MEKTISQEWVIATLEEATQSLPGAIAAETDLSGLDGWDSMGMVMFMGIVAEEHEVELSVHDLRTCTRASELFELIRGKVTA